MVSLLRYEPEEGEFYWRAPQQHRLRNKPAGCWHSRGYRVIRVMQKSYLIHRLAWFYVHGEWPEQIDHINGVRTDNRIANLRPANQSQNNANSPKRKDNTSGAKGVYFHKVKGKWCARIKPEGKKRVVIGYFSNVEDAAKAYADAAIEHFGNYARAA